MASNAGADSLQLSLAFYLGTVAVVLALLLVVYGYLITHQTRVNAWNALEAWFGRHAPHAWELVRTTLSRAGRRRLGIASVVVLFTLVAYAFGKVTISWRNEGSLFHIDRVVYEKLVETSVPSVERALGAITHLGDIELTLPVSLGLLLTFVVAGQRLRAIAIVLVMGVGQSVVWGLKFVFARERPSDALVDAVGAAFPSGHAFTGVTMYGFLIYLLWSSAAHPVLRSMLAGVLGGVAVLIAVSRVMLRVHWFSDVVAGFTLGLGWLICSLLLVHVLRRPRDPGTVVSVEP